MGGGTLTKLDQEVLLGNELYTATYCPGVPGVLVYYCILPPPFIVEARRQQTAPQNKGLMAAEGNETFVYVCYRQNVRTSASWRPWCSSPRRARKGYIIMSFASSLRFLSSRVFLQDSFLLKFVCRLYSIYIYLNSSFASIFVF